MNIRGFLLTGRNFQGTWFYMLTGEWYIRSIVFHDQHNRLWKGNFVILEIRSIRRFLLSQGIGRGCRRRFLSEPRARGTSVGPRIFNVIWDRSSGFMIMRAHFSWDCFRTVFRLLYLCRVLSFWTWGFIDEILLFFSILWISNKIIKSELDYNPEADCSLFDL